MCRVLSALIVSLPDQTLLTSDLGMPKYFATPCETQDAANLDEGATVKVRVEGVKHRVNYVIKVI